MWFGPFYIFQINTFSSLINQLNPTINLTLCFSNLYTFSIGKSTSRRIITSNSCSTRYYIIQSFLYTFSLYFLRISCSCFSFVLVRVLVIFSSLQLITSSIQVRYQFRISNFQLAFFNIILLFLDLCSSNFFFQLLDFCFPICNSSILIIQDSFQVISILLRHF